MGYFASCACTPQKLISEIQLISLYIFDSLHYPDLGHKEMSLSGSCGGILLNSSGETINFSLPKPLGIFIDENLRTNWREGCYSLHLNFSDFLTKATSPICHKNQVTCRFRKLQYAVCDF